MHNNIQQLFNWAWLSSQAKRTRQFGITLCSLSGLSFLALRAQRSYFTRLYQHFTDEHFHKQCVTRDSNPNQQQTGDNQNYYHRYNMKQLNTKSHRMGSLQSISSPGSNSVSQDRHKVKKKYHSKRIIKCGLVITPIQAQNPTVLGFSGTGMLLATAAVLTAPFTARIGPLVCILSADVLAITSLVAKKVMVHFSLWFELEGGIEIMVSFSKEGVSLSFLISFLDDYQAKNISDLFGLSWKADYKHKKQGINNIIRLINLKDNTIWKNVDNVMEKIEMKQYNLNEWNCKDYAQTIIKEIEKT